MDNKTSEIIPFDNKKHIMAFEFYFMARVKDETIDNWINQKKLELILTDVGSSFTLESVNRLVITDEFKLEREKSFITLTKEELKEYEQENLRLIGLISDNINKLIFFHKKYKYSFGLKNETAESASYLLFTRVFNLFNTMLNSFQNKYLNSFPLFRIANEAILLSEYFLITKNEKDGKRTLNAWYRKDISPELRNIGPMINNYNFDVFGEPLNKIYVYNRILIYNVQSKSIHNTYNDIFKLIAYDPIKPGTVEAEFEYDITSNVRELNQHLQYLLLNLPPIIISFLICFHKLSKILKDEDIVDLAVLAENINSDINKIKKSKFWNDKI